MEALGPPRRKAWAAKVRIGAYAHQSLQSVFFVLRVIGAKTKHGEDQSAERAVEWNVAQRAWL